MRHRLARGDGVGVIRGQPAVRAVGRVHPGDDDRQVEQPGAGARHRLLADLRHRVRRREGRVHVAERVGLLEHVQRILDAACRPSASTSPARPSPCGSATAAARWPRRCRGSPRRSRSPATGRPRGAARTRSRSAARESRRAARSAVTARMPAASTRSRLPATVKRATPQTSLSRASYSASGNAICPAGPGDQNLLARQHGGTSFTGRRHECRTLPGPSAGSPRGYFVTGEREVGRQAFETLVGSCSGRRSRCCWPWRRRPARRALAHHGTAVPDPDGRPDVGVTVCAAVSPARHADPVALVRRRIPVRQPRGARELRRGRRPADPGLGLAPSGRPTRAARRGPVRRLRRSGDQQCGDAARGGGAAPGRPARPLRPGQLRPPGQRPEPAVAVPARRWAGERGCGRDTRRGRRPAVAGGRRLPAALRRLPRRRRAAAGDHHVHHAGPRSRSAAGRARRDRSCTTWGSRTARCSGWRTPTCSRAISRRWCSTARSIPPNRSRRWRAQQAAGGRAGVASRFPRKARRGRRPAVRDALRPAATRAAARARAWRHGPGLAQRPAARDPHLPAGAAADAAVPGGAHGRARRQRPGAARPRGEPVRGRRRHAGDRRVLGDAVRRHQRAPVPGDRQHGGPAARRALPAARSGRVHLRGRRVHGLAARRPSRWSCRRAGRRPRSSAARAIRSSRTPRPRASPQAARLGAHHAGRTGPHRARERRPATPAWPTPRRSFLRRSALRRRVGCAAPTRRRASSSQHRQPAFPGELVERPLHDGAHVLVDGCRAAASSASGGGGSIGSST